MKRTKKLVGAVFTAIMLISLFMATASAVSATQADDTDTTATIEKIQKAIEEKGAKWTAGKTSVSGLSIEEKKMLCGAKIGPIPGDAIEISPPDVSMPIGTFDWRNKDGQNWMTSVKSQGPCGSCWIFGSTGAFEAQINIDANDPTIDFDSSEQHILSCSGGGDCDGGDPAQALIYIRDSGVPDEACFPYQADDSIPCGNTCPDWQGRACTCEWVGYPTYHTTENYKAILREYGPMVVVLNVSEDLFYCTGGIYEPVWTSEEFGWADHCVTLVGYDDTGGYWIIKNSWGPLWGEGGYGGVYYGYLEQYEYAFLVGDTSCPTGKPDLVIEKSVTIEDGTFTVNYTITNIGDGPAGESHVCKLVNGAVAKKVAVPPLGPGENYRGTFDPEPCPCGQTLNVTVCADCQDEVEESNETNNCEVNEVECPELPDLVIDRMWTEGRRDRCKVHFVVKNIGCVPAPGCHHATLFVNDIPVEEKHVRKDLGPGEQYESSFRTTVSCTDDVIRVCADNFNVVDELDETNNCWPPIVEKPDLVIENKWEEWAEEEGKYTVTYVIKNIGITTAPAGHDTTLFVDGNVVEHKEVPVPLEHGATFRDTFDTIIQCTEPKDTIKVCADDFNEVDELDETNNCLENEWICDEVVEKPDLVITKIETRGRGDKCRVSFVVKNIGTATALKGHKVTLFVNGIPVEEGRAVRRALGPGEEYESSFRTRVNCAALIEVCADNTNVVDESNEANNCLVL